MNLGTVLLTSGITNLVIDWMASLTISIKCALVVAKVSNPWRRESDTVFSKIRFTLVFWCNVNIPKLSFDSFWRTFPCACDMWHWNKTIFKNDCWSSYYDKLFLIQPEKNLPRCFFENGRLENNKILDLQKWFYNLLIF